MPYYTGDGNCPNYAGDYYRGDYYRGDPGFFGKLIKGFAGIAKGVLTGGALGGAGGVAKLIGSVVAPKASAMVATPSISPLALSEGPLVIGSQGPGQIGAMQPVGTMLPSGFIPGCQLKGTRPNKSGYYKQVVKGNPTQVVYIPKGSVCVKTRRLNVANPRALRRSIRRAQGFAKLARRVLTFVSAKPPKGKGKFKRAR